MTVINTNVSALIAQVNLDRTQQSLQHSIERLSSGLRINRAADDAAGLAISDSLTSAVRGTEQGVRNAQSGVSMIQTADGALSEVSSILQRMRELAVEASNSDLNATDRNAIQVELNQLGGAGTNSAVNSISNNTKYNGLQLLTGNLSVTYAAGSVGAVLASGLTVANADLSGAASSTSYTMSVCTFTGSVTYAGSGVTQTISIRDMTANDAQVLNFGAIGVRFSVQTTGTALTATQVLDDLVSGTIATNTGANSDFTTAASSGGVTIQAGPDAASTNQVSLNFLQMDTTSLGLASVDVSTTIASNNLITSLDAALAAVSNQRGTMGALQNNLQYTIDNLNVSDENLTAAKSRIMDLNVSAETVNFTKNQILQQAGTSVLAQANTAPQSVLSLLR